MTDVDSACLQYGRWIILNKDNPMGTIGKLVGHLDRVLMEQEWYFLGSPSPFEAKMEKTGDFESALEKKGALFAPRDECTWKIHLAHLPSDDRAEEKNREYLLHAASEQVKHSEEKHWDYRNSLLHSLISTLPKDLSLEAVADRDLAHKKTYYREQESYIKMYDRLERKDFGTYVHSAQVLESIYGIDSNIARYTLQSKLYQIACGRPVRLLKPRTHVVPLTKQQIMQKNYWDIADQLLLDTRVYEAMPTSLARYYDSSLVKKTKAVLVIQQFMKKVLQRVRERFDYGREMRRMDKKEIDRMKEKERIRLQQEKEKEIQAIQAAMRLKSLAEAGAGAAPLQTSSSASASAARLIQSAKDASLPPRPSSITMGCRPGTAPTLDTAMPNERTAPMELAASLRGERRQSRLTRRLSEPMFMSSCGSSTTDSPNASPMRRSPESNSDWLRTFQTEVRPMPVDANDAGTSAASSSSPTNVHADEKNRHDHLEELTYLHTRNVMSSPAKYPPRHPEDHVAASSSLPRPTSAQRKLQFIADSTQRRRTMGKSYSTPHGLPDDVMRRQMGDISMSTSIRFLQAVSGKESIYHDIIADKKHKKHRPASARPHSSQSPGRVHTIQR